MIRNSLSAHSAQMWHKTLLSSFTSLFSLHFLDYYGWNELRFCAPALKKRGHRHPSRTAAIRARCGCVFRACSAHSCLHNRHVLIRIANNSHPSKHTYNNLFQLQTYDSLPLGCVNDLGAHCLFLQQPTMWVLHSRVPRDWQSARLRDTRLLVCRV